MGKHVFPVNAAVFKIVVAEKLSELGSTPRLSRKEK